MQKPALLLLKTLPNMVAEMERKTKKAFRLKDKSNISCWILYCAGIYKNFFMVIKNKE